jgi:hypothetical protein
MILERLDRAGHYYSPLSWAADRTETPPRFITCLFGSEISIFAFIMIVIAEHETHG